MTGQEKMVHSEEEKENQDWEKINTASMAYGIISSVLTYV